MTSLAIENECFKNFSSRKTKAALVVIALCFSMAVMISSSPNVFANADKSDMGVSSIVAQTVTSTNLASVEIDCSLTPTFISSSFGNLPVNGNFTPGQFGGGNFTPGQFGDIGFPGNFTPGQFVPGGNFTPGQSFNGTLPAFNGNSFVDGRSLVMNESLYSDINSITGVAAVASILQVSENQNQTLPMLEENFTHSVPNYIIVGVPLSSSIIDTYPILPTNITAGRNLQARDSGVLVISENNSAYFGARVGDAIELLGRSFEVVGIHGASGLLDSQTLYMSLSDAQSLTNNTGNITSLKVFADSSSDVTSVVNAIKSLHPELSVVTAQTSGTSQDSTSSPSASVQQNASSPDLSYAAIAALVVVIALIVVAVTVRKRQKAKSDGSNVSDSSKELSERRGGFSFSPVSISEFRTEFGTILKNCLIVNSLPSSQNIKGEN